MRSARLVFLFLPLCFLRAQFFPFPGPGSGGTSGGTMTFVQDGSCQPSSGVTSCAITMSVGALTSGNLVTVIGDSGGLMQITSLVNGATTYTLGAGLKFAAGCSTGMSPQPPSPICEYILPSANTGGTTSTVTLNFGNFAAGVTTLSGTSAFYVTEWAPSASGSLVGLAGDQMQYNPTASTTQLGPAVTANGTNPVTATSIYGTGNFSNITAVGAPYASHKLLNGAWLGDAAAATLSPASWTIVSDKTLGGSMVFAFSPAAISQGSVLNFTCAASSTALTAALMSSCTQGFNGGIWANSGGGGSIIDSGSNRTVLSSYGPLNDGASISAGATLSGTLFTSNGSNTDGYTFSISGTRTTQTSYYAPPFSHGGWFWTDGSCSGSWNFDALEIGGNANSIGDFINERVSGNAGTCNFAVETQNLLGGGSVNVAFTSSQWYWVDEFFDGRTAAATFTNGSASISATNTFVSGQWVNFTTTGALPTNFATGTAYCVSATGLSGSAFQVAATCGGSSIVAGSAGTSPWKVVNSHTGKVYNATNVTGATCSAGTTTVTTAGLPAINNIVNGITVYIQNVTPTAWNGTFTGITVSGNNISYSQTCPGSAYSSGGAITAQVGSTQAGAAVGDMFFSVFNWGVFETITSGIHVRHGYHKVSYTGTDPLLP